MPTSAPGLHREVRLDDDGQIEWVEIRNTLQGRELCYFPKTKKARLSEFTPRSDLGLFRFELEKLDAPNLQWVGKRTTTTGEVNVFRNAYRDHVNEVDRSIDFWIDAKTKQLVTMYTPGADIYDPEHDPARDNRPKKRIRTMRWGAGSKISATTCRWTIRCFGWSRLRVMPSKSSPVFTSPKRK